MHNANMFFQQTSAVRMIDHIVTSPNSLHGINHRSCSAQVSRHPEYHYFRQDCDLRNRINHSIIIKIHDLRSICQEFEACKKKKEKLRGTRVFLRGTWVTHSICFTVFRLTFVSGKWKCRSGIKYTHEVVCVFALSSVDGSEKIVHSWKYARFIQTVILFCVLKYRKYHLRAKF